MTENILYILGSLLVRRLMLKGKLMSFVQLFGLMANNKFCSFLAVMTASAMVMEADAEQMKNNKRN